MQAISTSQAIMVAGCRILKVQSYLGGIVIVATLYTQGMVTAESALMGSLIAIVPTFLGNGLAAFKSRSQPKKGLKDLINISRRTKLVYTMVLFIATFRAMTLHDTVVLCAFSVVMLGHFMTPWQKEHSERKA